MQPIPKPKKVFELPELPEEMTKPMPYRKPKPWDKPGWKSKAEKLQLKKQKELDNEVV